MTKEAVFKWLKEAIDLFYKNDFFLLENDVSERAMTHRLGLYLQLIIGDSFHVDCEYNRMGKLEKGVIYFTEGDYFAKTVCLSEGQVSDESDLGSRVFPDIIIHKRGTAENLVIIEVKVNGKKGDRKQDFKKLDRYKEDLKYKYAIFVELFESKSDLIIEFTGDSI